jgi:hypothetical protein
MAGAHPTPASGTGRTSPASSADYPTPLPLRSAFEAQPVPLAAATPAALNSEQ